MEAREIYYALQSIVESIHAHNDQMVAIAKWIEAEFEYKPNKFKVKIIPEIGPICPKCHSTTITTSDEDSCLCLICKTTWDKLKIENHETKIHNRSN